MQSEQTHIIKRIEYFHQIAHWLQSKYLLFFCWSGRPDKRNSHKDYDSQSLDPLGYTLHQKLDFHKSNTNKFNLDTYRFWVTKTEIMQLKGLWYCRLRNNTMKIQQHKVDNTILNYFESTQCWTNIPIIRSVSSLLKSALNAKNVFSLLVTSSPPITNHFRQLGIYLFIYDKIRMHLDIL